MRHQSDKNNIHSAVSSSNTDSDTGVAVEDQSVDLIQYVVKKTEKIAQALYVLTGHLPAEEPFRRNIREKSLRLVDDLFALQTEPGMETLLLNQIVNQRFNELLSILEIGVRASLLSDMNLSVIKSEILKLRQLVKDTKLQSDHQAVQLSDSFFVTASTPRRQTVTLDQPSDSSVLSQSKLPNPSPNLNPRTNKFTATNNEESASAEKTNSADTAESNARSSRRQGRNHSKRRQSILGLFRDQDEISINEVQGVIEGCSQKTMQRELKSMVESGLLEKRGKKRWSTYVLDPAINLEEELTNF